MRPPGLGTAYDAARAALIACRGVAGLAVAELSRQNGSNSAPLRSFDPERVGELEAATWTAYYHREWAKVLPLSLRLVREVFVLPWPEAVRGATLVALATRAWAPVPDNAPDTARDHMRGFYELVTHAHGEPPDPAEAARLEVEWWRVHRELAESGAADKAPLVDALAAKYAYVYQVEADTTAEAARLRAEAMTISDQWVRGHLHGDSEPRAVADTLVKSYQALSAAVC